MNKTTGALATAASMDFLVSSESLRMDWTKDGVRGRNAEIGLVARGMARRAWSVLVGSLCIDETQYGGRDKV